MINYITPLQQPTDTSCTLTCVAMVSGLEVGTVIQIASNLFNKDMSAVGVTSCEMLKLLDAAHMTHEHVWPIVLEFGNVYIVSVPSLNTPAVMHSVVFDMRDEFEVLDPNINRPGKKYYVHSKPVNDMEVEVRCYTEVILINGPWMKKG